ncbi:MAG: DNA polymerase/3'-5' exonuclease PolX [Nanoarchaeota archaeon]|nr:DNA polymerase/3'-5' exonuclease PolX [Nanoarchaeota archaeon]
MKNQEIARIFYAIADILEMKEVQWKPNAYRKAARALESLSEDVEKIYKQGGLKALEEIPGVGKSIAEKIVEYLKTGKIKKYEKLKKSVPINVEELMEIEGLGPKKIKLLYKKLKIKNIKDLEKAAKQGKIAKLPRMGEKTQENILKAIAFAKRAGQRKLLGYALPIANEIVDELKKLKEINKIKICGSLARKKETIGDIDILVTTNNPKKVMDYFTSMKNVKDVIAKGETKSTIVYNDIQVDLRVVKPENFGSAIQYFIGSKEHNVHLRKIAISKGYKLSEYGLFKGEKRVAGKTEEEIYKKLGMDWIPPELREDRGEIEAAQKHKLPKLVELKDIRGDLQMHTKYSDGSHTIKQMAETAKNMGHEYIAITDHGGKLAIAHALKTQKEINEQRKEIEKVSKEVGIKILHGVEVDINLDGTLAMSNNLLKNFDIVLAAIHTGLKRDKKQQTMRIIKAMENEYVDIIAHPTGRIINVREGYELDFEKIFEVAKKTKTFLEINAYPSRLDLNDINIKAAIENGVMLSIGTDSHSKDHLRFIELGVYTARRGWCQKKNIINTLSYKQLIKKLKK